MIDGLISDLIESDGSNCSHVRVDWGGERNDV